jgi:hypothetical protein
MTTDTKLWNRVATTLAPEGKVVMTMSPGGIETSLKRQGNLWFHPDGGMYVYYTPSHWREMEPGEK